MLQDVALYRILVDRLEGSWDLVTKVIKKVTILIITYNSN